MGILNLFKNKAVIFQEKTAEYHNRNLSEYQYAEYKLTGLEDVDGVQEGDVLLLNFGYNRSLKSIGFYTLRGKDFGRLLQKDADDLTIRKNISFIPSPDSRNYKEERYFYSISGFAFVKSIAY